MGDTSLGAERILDAVRSRRRHRQRHFVGLMRDGIRVLTAMEFADEYGL
jgi:hypothetical protein